MLALLLSEWRRFWRPTLSVAVVHLLLQWLAYHFNIRLFDLRAQGQSAVLGFYLLASAIFALAQLKAYVTPGRWQWLIHRPLPLTALFGALALAAAAHLAIMVVLPVLVAAVSIDWFTTDTIDLHHYLMVLFLLEACLIGWLLVAISMFGRNMFGGLAIALPAMLVLPAASGLTTVLLAAAAIAFLTIVALGNFKADRTAPHSSPTFTTLAAASILPGFHLLIVVIAMTWFDSALRFAGAMPGHRGYRPSGGLYEASRIDQRSNIKAAVALSTDPRREEWNQRLAKATTGAILPEIGRFSVRYQLSNSMTPTPHVRADGLNVAFDQNLMRFVLTDGETGKVLEQFGHHGDTDLTPFPAIPVDIGQFRLAPQVVYSHAPDSYRSVVRAILPHTEQIVAAPVKVGEQYYLLTSRRVVVYLPDPVVPFAQWKEVASVPLPSPVRDLSIVDVAVWRDLTLLTFTGGRGMKHGAPAGQQTVVTLDPAGHSAIVAQRALAHDYPLLYEHMTWLMSPASYAAVEMLDHLNDIGNTPNVLEQDTRFLERPQAAWLAALALMLASSAAAWRLLRHKARLGWTLACLVFGLPALATLMALRLRRVVRSGTTMTAEVA